MRIVHYMLYDINTADLGTTSSDLRKRVAYSAKCPLWWYSGGFFSVEPSFWGEGGGQGEEGIKLMMNRDKQQDSGADDI